MKNLIMFNNVKYKTRLCALSLTGIVLISALGGCSKKNDLNDFNISDEELQRIEEEYGENGTRKVFEIGEHSCSSIISDDKNIPYIDGYECVTVKKNDDSSVYYAIYVNIVPVECLAHSKDENGNFIYDVFGTPVEVEEVKTRTKSLN